MFPTKARRRRPWMSLQARYLSHLPASLSSRHSSNRDDCAHWASLRRASPADQGHAYARGAADTAEVRDVGRIVRARGHAWSGCCTVNRETLAALKSADVQSKLSDFGFEIYGGPPEHLSGVVKSDIARMAHHQARRNKTSITRGAARLDSNAPLRLPHVPSSARHHRRIFPGLATVIAPGIVCRWQVLSRWA